MSRRHLPAIATALLEESGSWAEAQRWLRAAKHSKPKRKRGRPRGVLTYSDEHMLLLAAYLQRRYPRLSREKALKTVVAAYWEDERQLRRSQACFGANRNTFLGRLRKRVVGRTLAKFAEDYVNAIPGAGGPLQVEAILVFEHGTKRQP
jgi:hypothetical protein